MWIFAQPDEDEYGILACSQSGKLKMWNIFPEFKLALDLDALHHVGTTQKVHLLHFRRQLPPSSILDARNILTLSKSDLLIVGGNETLSFVDPKEKKVLRRLDFPIGVESLAQWRNLCMVGGKFGHIFGLDPLSGVTQLTLQFSTLRIVEMVGGDTVLRAVTERGKLGLWAMKQNNVVKLGDLDSEFNGTCYNPGEATIASGHLHTGTGNFEVLRRMEAGQERW